MDKQKIRSKYIELRDKNEMESDFPETVKNKCFGIEIDAENIRFDYILRDGITRKMNTVVLMEQMGIT